MKKHTKEEALKIILDSVDTYEIRQLTNPTDKVLAIFRKRYNESVFKDCVYLSKGQSLGKLHIPGDIKNEIAFVRQA